MKDFNLLQAIPVIVGIITMLILWWQIRSEFKWKKISFSIDKIDLTLLETNGNVLNNAGIDMKDDKLSSNDYKFLIDKQNEKLLFVVCDILDMFERFATLYNMDVFNNYFAYEAYGENILFFYSKFSKIIEFCRVKYDPLYYNNFEKCANKILGIREKELEIMNKKSTKINIYRKKAIRKLNSMQEKVKFESSVLKDKFN